MRAALYTRVSTDEQVEKGYSLEAQKKRLMEFCTINNYEIYKLYSDEGISGHSIQKRKALQDLLQDAKNKCFDCVIVYKTDRLSRNLLDLLTIKKDLDNYDIELIMSDESIDTSDDTGMAMFSIMGAFAEMERKKICERLMTGKRQKVKDTGIKPKQGVIPYGYLYDEENKKYVVDERYRKTIEDIFRLFDKGWSYNQIAKDYLVPNQVNFGRSKSRWHASDVTRILRNPIYKGWTGISYYNTIHTSTKLANETILVKATNVEPIINEALWNRVSEKSHIKNDYFKRKYPSDIFVFAGILYCSHCGYCLSTNQSTSRTLSNGDEVKYLYYECNSKFKLYTEEEKCKGFLINTNSFNKMFFDFVKNIGPTKGTITKKLGYTDSKALNKARENLEQQIIIKTRHRENLLEKLLEGTITDDDYKLMNNKIVNDVNKMKSDLSELKNKISVMDDAIAFEDNVYKQVTILKELIRSWGKIPNEEKRTLLRKCIKRIYVDKDGIKKIEFN